MAYQSLYRRYRPRRFGEIRGQDHVVKALQTAVRESTVGHAYLLHGPRGTGKTSTARVLARALNCEDLGADAEPCGSCESCVSINQSRSFDLFELDAASNNKVDDMRTLLERVGLATPGRAKVYLLDEVHMLTPGAENALLKSLEEPPSHVTWVLATTEPHKVAQTIRSRCQVFELGLVGADIMGELVRFVIDDAQLDVDDDAIDHVVAAGGGSARDTLTALERVVAVGGTVDLDSSTDTILGALADHDRVRALSAVGDAVGRGRDPRTIGETVLAGMRDAFLVAMGDPPPRLSEQERARADGLAEQMPPAAMTRALETLGRALIDMRQAPDPRIDIEVALVRLCQTDQDSPLEALAQRVRRLEERVSGQGGPAHSPPTDARVAPSGAPSRPGSAAPSKAEAAAPAATGSSGGGSSRGATAAPAATGAPGGGSSRRSRLAQAARESLGPRPAAAGARSGPAPARAAPPPPGPPPSPGPPPVSDPAALRPQTAKEVVELASRHLGLSQQFVVDSANELLPPKQGAPRGPGELLTLWQHLVAHWAQQQPQPSLSQTASPEPDPEQQPESPAAPEAADPSVAPQPPAAPSDASAPPAAPAGAPQPPPATTGAPPSPVAPPDAPQPPPASSGAPPPPQPSEAGTSADSLHDEYDLAELGDLDDLQEAPSHAEDIEATIKQLFPGAKIEHLPEADDA